jgi:DNA-binding transcriptional regulator GbsR (MarR family)
MDRAQRLFIDRLGDTAEADGLSPIAGRLFALLMLAPEPQSLDDLAAALGVSKASVSTDARRLLERGIVERTRRTGDRRDFYELVPDFFARVIRARVARWRRIQQLVDTVRDDSDALSAPARERFYAVDAIQSAVIDRVDEALADWEREATKRRAAARSKRRSA